MWLRRSLTTCFNTGFRISKIISTLSLHLHRASYLVRGAKTTYFRRYAYCATKGAASTSSSSTRPSSPPTAAFAEKTARGYKDINLLGFKLLRPGGPLATYSCSGSISADLFQKIIAGAALDVVHQVNRLEWPILGLCGLWRFSEAAVSPSFYNVRFQLFRIITFSPFRSFNVANNWRILSASEKYVHVVV